MQPIPKVNIIDHVSREFCMTKSDWLQLAVDCITVANLEDDCISIKKAKMSLTYEMEWQRQKEGKR